MPSIRSSRVVVGGEVRPSTVRFEQGLIVEIFDGPADRDLGDLLILPGLVDSHVHINEPGRTDWEGFETATRAAAAGGTTTIIDMPLNSIPPTTKPVALATKRSAARGKLSVDVGFWGGVVPGSEGHIEELVAEGVSGFKMFMVDSGVEEFPPMAIEGLTGALASMSALGVPALIHAEASEMFQALGSTVVYQEYLESRPVQSEVAAVETAARLGEETGAEVHVLHVSSGHGADMIGRTELTGETCPHYLTFAAEEIPDGATQFKCTPPIRERSHREALWDALGSGALSMVVSDHSPAPADIKALDTGDFGAAWGGISSLQLRAVATWHEATTRGFGPVDLAEWLSTSPARLAGLGDRKGSIKIGMDADLMVFDPDARSTVYGADLEHRHPITPYEGMTMRGRVVETLLGGNVVFDGVVHPGHGRMLRRND